MTYSDFHPLTADELHAAHNVLLHLDKLGELLCQVGPEGAGSSLAESMAYIQLLDGLFKKSGVSVCPPMPPFIPILPLPKSLPALVEDDCGGGFSICDAVGARDWRIEYVRCILGE